MLDSVFLISHFIASLKDAMKTANRNREVQGDVAIRFPTMY